MKILNSSSWNVKLVSRQIGSSATPGFTLVEMLAVIAIIGILIVGTVPAINSLAASKGVSGAAYEVSSILELARNEAVARQTYVWAGFQNGSNAGSGNLRFALVSSKDGTTNAASTNLLSLTRVITVDRVTMTASSPLKVGTKPVSIAELSSNDGLSFTVGPVKFDAKHSITFTPRGEAMLAPAPTSQSGFDAAIGIGLQAVRGTSVVANNDVAVLLDGSVGVPRILRLP